MINLKTERLILRNYTVDDIPEVYKYFSDERVARYEDFYPMTLNEVTEEITEWTQMDNRLIAVLKTSGQVVGSAGYWVDDDGSYSIDYDFNPEFWGNGYAYEAASEVVRYLFEEKGALKIYGDCDERNTASAKLLEKLGFELIYQDKNGSYKNDADGNPVVITINIYKKVK